MSGFYQRALAAKGDYGTLALDKALTEELLGILRRDWAVRVLDAWADDHEHCKRSYEVRPTDGTVEARAVCVLRHRGIDSHFGNYDTCKLFAAEAVWPELPESVRAELGERP